MPKFNRVATLLFVLCCAGCSRSASLTANSTSNTALANNAAPVGNAFYPGNAASPSSANSANSAGKAVVHGNLAPTGNAYIDEIIAERPPTVRHKNWIEISPAINDAFPSGGLLSLYVALQRNPRAMRCRATWGFGVFGHYGVMVATYDRKTKTLRQTESGEYGKHDNTFGGVSEQMLHDYAIDQFLNDGKKPPYDLTAHCKWSVLRSGDFGGHKRKR